MKTIVLTAGETVNYINLDLLYWIETYEESGNDKFPYKIKFLGVNGNTQTIGYKKEKDRDQYVEQIKPLLNIINVDGEMVGTVFATLSNPFNEEEPKKLTPKEDVLTSDYDPMEAIK